MSTKECCFYCMDTGLHALAAIARFHQIPADTDQLIHEFCDSESKFSDTEILRAAKSLGMKAKVMQVTVSKMPNAALPCIAKAKEGHYFLLVKISADDPEEPQGMKPGAIVHSLSEPAPKHVTLDKLARLWSGEIIALTKRATLKDTLSDKFDISWFLTSLVKYKRLFTEIVIASFFLQLFALVTPLFFQVVMDKVLVHRGFSTLDVLAVGFFAVVLFEAILGGIRTYIFSHTTNRVDVELGSKLFKHLMALPLAYFEARQVGQNVARVRELDSIRNFITGTALTLVIDLSFVFIFFAVMWYYSPTLTWIVLGTIPFYVLLSLIITPSLRSRLEEKFKHGAANTAFLTESITGIGTVKSMAVEPQMRRKLEDHLSSYVHASFKSQNLSNIANQCAGFINKLMTLGIIWFGAHLVIDNEITVGQLVAFNMIAGRVSGPILKLVQLWQDFQQAGISIERLGDILNAPAEPGFNPNRSRLESLKGQVDFKKVRFRYRPDGPTILDDINLSVKAGEVVGIVGRSGSGKSTITKLVQHLYSPDSGRLTIDGIDMSTIDISWLRRQIGTVLQENFLFNRSIRENIAITNPSVSLDKVIEAAKLAGAHEFIGDLPDGYDTLVGEQGSNLSGGQRQRIAIARALINDPRIVIFDEATSALDYESERIIQDNMNAICDGRTVFIIAHRLSAVRQCDRIIVMEQGRIVEQGTHQQLLATDGYYAKLNRYQSDDNNLHEVSEGTKPPDSKVRITTNKDAASSSVRFVSRSDKGSEKQ